MEQEENLLNTKTDETAYGKFKSAEELLKAYNALESEFTRRSQKLKEYENRSAVKSETESLEKQAEKLVEKYPIASEYADEVAKTALENTDGGMESALIKVLAGKIKTTDQMATDKTVVKKVLNDEDNRESVIGEYLAKVRETPAPNTIRGGAVPAQPPYKPRTLKEAGDLARKVLERL
jgi:hypothetical protein